MATRTIGDIQKTNGKASLDDSLRVSNPEAHNVGETVNKNDLNELGQKIFLDRYAMKDMKKRTLAVGDLVIVCVDDKTGQREIGTVTELEDTAPGAVGRVKVELKDGTVVNRLTEHISKPIETSPEQMMERVARGIAAVEGENADDWYARFRWLLNGWKFVPAGRILTAAGTDQQLTFYNCMPPEQEILTAEGYKPIAEVKIGDLVVTHRNRLRPVLHKFERETEEPIYIIKAKKLGDDDLRLTGEHKVLAIRSAWVNTHKSRDDLKLQQEPQWIAAKELLPGDFIALPYDGKPKPESAITISGYADYDELWWKAIEDISTTHYVGRVLDIEVEDDHSFVSAGMVVSNCYVIPSPKDSRKGIVDTLSQMMEIMSRGGGVGINVSSLRPRHSYVKGVNGRSSGSVSWGALYSFVTGLIEQGGCLTPDTLVCTEEGLLRLDEIVTHPEKGWREQHLTVMTDEGEKRSRQVFNNGIAEVLNVKTDAGLSLTGTPNHKVKVMTESGAQWRRLDALQRGDAIMVKLGQHQGQRQSLQKPERKHHNQDAVALPDTLDEELGFFLGYLAGDGFMTSREGDWRLGVAVAHDSYLIPEMPALMQRLFTGVNVRTQQKDNDASLIYSINNRVVKEFLQLNGFAKARSAEVVVPRLIRQSPPHIVAAFLRGLFEANGSVSHGYPSLLSSSKRLIDEVAALLIGLGCPVKIDPQTAVQGHYGHQPIWRLRVHSFKGLASWKQKIGCDTRSRFAACANFEPDTTREISYKLPNANYWLEPVLAATMLPQIDHRARGERLKATDQILRRKLQRYTRGERNLSLSAYANLSQTPSAFAENAPPVNDIWFVYVDSVQKAGQAQTLDIEVDDNHTYLANGLVTHNSRRGALMLILNCWHPDILEFINAKRDMGKINNANVSVGVTDKFMEAVHADADWDLLFADPADPDFETMWDGNLDKWLAAGKPTITYQTVKARDIWNAIIESAWSSAEPGVFFIERANKDSNSWYYDAGYLGCTNPCGEQPLPGFGVCNLGAINLSKFVRDGEVEWDDLGKAVRYAVRFLDNVIDATPYFFEENYEQQKSERRVGLNTMGLAEMLIRLGIRYGSDESVKFIDKLYRFITSNSYEASADIAAEKGAFPMFEADKFLQSGFMQRMPEAVRQTVREKGMRNVTLLTQAPNGTIGTMVGTSTGIEPFYFWSYYRKSRLGKHEERVKVLEEWQQANQGEVMPDYFVTAMDLAPEEHVKVQAAIQRWVDSSISKTCNLPNSYTVDQTREVYELLYSSGCKGGTIYRDGSRDVQVLNLKEEDKKTGNPAAAKNSTDDKAEADNQTGVKTAAPTLPAVAPPVVSAKGAASAEGSSLTEKIVPMETSAKPKIRPRPYKRRGVTVSKNTPSGTAHITMNEDEEQQPFEVFLEIGKAGSDIKAMAEAMGRLMSLVLRIESPISPVERVREIVKQITGIGGARSYGYGKRRVLSLPDAVGQALAENYLGVATGTQDAGQGAEMGIAELELGSALTPETKAKFATKTVAEMSADLCPSCGDSAFVRIEGCHTCYACGYSEC
ncbi:MAG: adenosylcobalamin-dependent ribonucleoside-diphosphate reductase [Acidobacteria bacterium]|nr:adenosylcobalamin-dependent ribonucleoside-diphosphate reductase [Acidobacteriota bacterium]